MPLETGVTENTLLESVTPELVELLVQTRTGTNEHDRSFANKYFVCESFDVIFDKLQDTLTYLAPIVPAKATHVVTEEAPTFVELLEEQDVDGKS